jgi:hypothetical protein
MLGQFVGTSESSPSAGRYFRYEVVGLRQNNESDKQDHAIRSSSSTFVTVSYSRMNDEMQRILRLGGKIVNITPCCGSAEGSPAAAAPQE